MAKYGFFLFPKRFSISQFIYFFYMASKKIVKLDNSLLYASIVFNLIAVIVILIILLRRRKSSEVVLQAINTVIE